MRNGSSAPRLSVEKHLAERHSADAMLGRRCHLADGRLADEFAFQRPSARWFSTKSRRAKLKSSNFFVKKEKNNNFIGSEKCQNSSSTLRCRYNFKPEVNNKLERSRSFFYFVLYFYFMLGACTTLHVLRP